MPHHTSIGMHKQDWVVPHATALEQAIKSHKTGKDEENEEEEIQQQ
jgi:hypothetical protein